MTEKIARYKDQADWSVEEIVANRRDGTVPEREEYVKAKRQALADAGLLDEDEDNRAADEHLPPEGWPTSKWLEHVQQSGGRP